MVRKTQEMLKLITRRQRQGYYEQDTHHDDIGGQRTEMMGKDLTCGINELQLEEQEELDKVAIFD